MQFDVHFFYRRNAENITMRVTASTPEQALAAARFWYPKTWYDHKGTQGVHVLQCDGEYIPCAPEDHLRDADFFEMTARRAAKAMGKAGEMAVALWMDLARRSREMAASNKQSARESAANH